MKFKIILLMTCMLMLCSSRPVFCDNGTASPSPPSMKLEDIISRVESRYDVTGFSATFYQESTLTAMQITDTAEGTAKFKRPGMMRWEYVKPERQQIITDGKTLWIYRPDENQVMLGSALAVFGDGKGASFLCDIRTLRKKFEIAFEGEDDENYVLNLAPREKSLELSKILLFISKKTFDAVKVATFTVYGDQTLIKLSNIIFNKDLDNHLFTFEIPEATDILKLEQ